jgi:sterol desaturase/sphingolipid hydroxylase (fatty acid hydroxylase superfamily)
MTVDLNIIGVAVPVFMFMIVVEWCVGRLQGRQIYRLNDAISDLTCGMGDQLIGLLIKGTLIGIYVGLYNLWHFYEWSTESGWIWAFGLLSVDFCYYWYHRFSHRVNFAWASHVVHHQSEEYNLAVALRQPWFAQTFSWAFYLPLALLGLPPVVYVTSFSLNLLYQFWIHTRIVGTLGPFGLIFNTPSHHRVHHGSNEKYLDKNYAGILIIWDRMFGTFKQEEEEPQYGVVKPLKSWSPIWANVGPIIGLFKLFQDSTGLWDKLTCWFRPPEWDPVTSKTALKKYNGRGYDTDTLVDIKAYIIGQLFPVSVVLSIVIAYSERLSLAYLWIGGGYVAWTSLVWSGLLEKRVWAWPLEITRLLALLVLGGYCYFLLFNAWVLSALIWSLFGISVVWIMWLRHRIKSVPQAVEIS